MRYSAVALSAFNLACAGYLALTDTAWVMRGRPAEEYPELLFLVLVAPASVVALVLALLSVRSQGTVKVGMSLVMNLVLLGVTATVLSVQPDRMSLVQAVSE